MTNHSTILSTINAPSELRNLSLQEMQQLAGEIRTCLVDTVMETGGHLASNLGIVELSIALLRVFQLPEDKIIYDVGHQCYVHKLLTGRRDSFSTLRSFGGISGFQSPEESIYDFFRTGHASTSVSAAIGMARAARLKGERGCFVAVCGDGALTGGMIYEALNDGGATDLPIIVILNDNEMSIDANVGVFPNKLAKLRLNKNYIHAKGRYHSTIDKLPHGNYFHRYLKTIKDTLRRILIPDTLLDHLGFEFLGTVNGNSIEELLPALGYASKRGHPVLLHVKTVKGLGYPEAETNPEKFHGIPRQKHETETTPKREQSSFSKEFGKALVDIATEDPLVCAITAAMPGGTGLLPFREKFGDRFFDVGIAEEHAVTMAAGLSKGGAKPVVCLYSTFLQRSYDQLLNDCALADIPVVLAIDRADMARDDGITHNGIYDVAFLSTLPGIHIYAPSNYAELRSCLRKMLKDYNFTAIRYPRGSEGDYKDNSFTNASKILATGNNSGISLICYGTTVNKAIRLCNRFQRAGIPCGVIKLNQIHPIPEELMELLARFSCIGVVEEVIARGSVGQSLRVLASENNVSLPPMRTFALPEKVPHGDILSLEKFCGIDDDAIFNQLTMFYHSLKNNGTL